LLALISLLGGGYGLMKRLFTGDEVFFGFLLFALSLPIGLAMQLNQNLLFALNFWVWGAFFIQPWIWKTRAKGLAGFVLELAVLVVWVMTPLWLMRSEMAPLEGWLSVGASVLALLPMSAYLWGYVSSVPVAQAGRTRQSFALMLIVFPWVAGLIAGVDLLWLLALSWLGVSVLMAQMQQRMSYDMLVLLPWMVFLVALALLPVFSVQEAALSALYWQEWVFVSVLLLGVLMLVRIEQRRKMTLVAAMTLLLGYELLLPAMLLHV
jgi:hypothetical protein